ncbi:SCO7613 C-terminal domain-containing membrane protein [Streptomyces sp. KLOTTS4A1]|uniref:SCO7613 C-terminal domain-containing membrane protein n=1 Tax=Streptomyces sp. KLOTTS4A1 TaxID=3390996 RepID=UPI0039F48066
MTSIPPPVEELRIIDHEMARLDARRAQLLARRAWLVGILQQTPPAAPGHPPHAGAWAPPRAAAGTPPHPAGGAPQAGQHPRSVRPEAAPPGVQNVLLVLGGILLAIGAIAFTVVSWGAMGIGGRSAVLAALTLGALGLPAVLLRRGLTATAEAIAAVGLLLTVLDAYALHAVALPDANPLGYAAVAAAVLATLWTAYGLLLPRLRLPAPAGVATAQLPLLLWWAASGTGLLALSTALLLTAAGSTAAALFVTRGPLRVTAAVGATATGGFGLLAATGVALGAQTTAAAGEAAAPLLFAAVIALWAAWRAPRTEVATGAAAVAAAAVLLAAGGVLRTSLPGDWPVVALLLCTTALLPLVRGGLPQSVRRGLAGTCAGAYALALTWSLPAISTAVLGRAEQLTGVWAGPVARQVTPGADGLAVVAVLLIVGGVLAGAYGLGEGHSWRTAAAVGAAAVLWSALTVLPLALRLPHTTELTAHLLLSAVSLAAAVQSARRTPPLTPAAQALAVTALTGFFASAFAAMLLALASEAATLLGLGVLLTLGIAATALHPSGERQSVLAVTTVVLAAALALAVPAALDVPVHRSAFALLAVPAATALLAARLPARPYTLPVELAGAAAGLLALALAATDAPALSLALALSGVIAAGTALRADRRPVAAYTAGALFLLATWVRLAASGIATPEAYTLPASLPALAIGLLRRRRDPESSSWSAYGPGLSLTMLPSLVAAWDDPHWLRPLLLGCTALVVTLLGARHRLLAPLSLGGGTLVLVALHELAPYVVQVVGALPRWLPPAAAGMLLLAVGATYEQRLRNARRLRELLGRMH